MSTWASFIELRAFHHPQQCYCHILGHDRHYYAPVFQSRRRCRNGELQSILRDNDDEDDDDGYYDENIDIDDIDELEEDGTPNRDDESSTTITKTRFRARAAYCGTAHSGWQAQRNTTTTTIQGEIENALSTRFHRDIPVVGASRTDAGVHARGQAFHFDLLSSELPPIVISTSSSLTFEAGQGMDADRQQLLTDYDTFCSKLQHSMNRMLPSDIRIFNLQLAPSPSTTTAAATTTKARPWHAIQSAKAKWYSYRFTLGPTLRNPMDRYIRTHFVHRPSFAQRRRQSSSSTTTVELQHHPSTITKLDINRLQRILQLFEGTHDFRAFGGQLEQNEKKRKVKFKHKKFDTVRTVYKVELIKEDEEAGKGDTRNTDFFFHGEEGNYRIDFLLQGALYKMVRNMVGTAMECWLGRLSEEQIVNLLSQNHSTGATDDDDDDDEGEEGVDNGNSCHRNRQFQRRDNPCKPAPPEGLTLECVYYDDGF
ncbi:hypothetical protein ACHAXH_003747 [Discostella pseudostelligera]